MSGGRHGLMSVSILLLSILVACGGDREAGAPAAAGSRDTAQPVTPDTAAATVAGRSDTAVTAAQPGAAQEALPKQPPAPPKPANPKPKPAPAAARPATPEPSDTQTAAAPAEPTQPTPAPAETSAPLRDAYHQAPLDTVSQQTYDGWKQYNLNCARCHGEDVQGTTIAPHLIESVRPGGSIPTKELFMQTVCAGRPEKGMPAWCPLGLEMSKIEATYLYVKGRSEGKIRPGRPAVRQ